MTYKQEENSNTFFKLRIYSKKSNIIPISLVYPKTRNNLIMRWGGSLEEIDRKAYVAIKDRQLKRNMIDTLCKYYGENGFETVIDAGEYHFNIISIALGIPIHSLSEQRFFSSILMLYLGWVFLMKTFEQFNLSRADNPYSINI